MPANTGEVLRSALVPESLFADDYDTFKRERADLLTEAANKLI
jgi:hypothetical protein